MHESAMENAKRFFKSYAKHLDNNKEIKIVEIGSQNINGTLRDAVPKHLNVKYIGVDLQEGKNVDVVLSDPYKLPFEAEYADIVLSSSCYEHTEMFWLLQLEILRILKPHGLFYLNAPSNGFFHRYSIDAWRFYPDSGNALVAWAKYNKINSTLLESFISNPLPNPNDFNWHDFVAVFLKDEAFSHQFPDRITDTFQDYYNGIVLNKPNILKFNDKTEYNIHLEKTIAMYDKKIVNVNLCYITILLIVFAVIIFKRLWRKPN